MLIPKLYAIADTGLLTGRGISLREHAEELMAAGVSLVQLRDKLGLPQQVLRTAAVITEVFAGANRLLIMNDRADFAVLAGFNGVHVGQGDLSPEDVKTVIAARGTPHRRSEMWGSHPGVGIVGVSTNTEAQVVVAELSVADYIAIGPVFTTGTKLDAQPIVGLEGVRRARAITSKPLVAIGGITRENARSVIDAGADSVAVISGLFVAGESVERVARDFIELLG